MTAIEKFTFALSFDDADNVIRSAGDDDEHYELGKKKKKKKDDTPPPPPAIYTEAQANQMVAEAEKKGHEEGYAEGHRAGYDDAHQQIMSSLEKAIGDVESEIAVKLDHIDEQQKRANAKINEDAIHVALGIIRKLAPAWSKQYQLTEIEDIVRQCLANLFDAPKVMIKVNPDLEKEVGEAAERIAVSRGFSGRVVVVGEADVAVGDCQVSWGDGTAVRDSARVWSEINTIIDNALSMHAGEHDLSQSNMGDPEVQESRLPPEAKTPEADVEPTPVHETPVSQTEAAPQPSLQLANPPQAPEQSVTQSAPQSDVSPTQSAAPDMVNGQSEHTSSVQEPEAPMQSANAAPEEGDGTDARNVQTSNNDAVNSPENALENQEHQAEPPVVTAQSAQEPPRDANSMDETAEAPTAQPTVQSAAKQTTDADEMAAAKQPIKDAGDENG